MRGVHARSARRLCPLAHAASARSRVRMARRHLVRPDSGSRGDCRRVEEAEAAHLVGARVVAGRTHHGESRPKLAAAHPLRQRENRAGGEPSRPPRVLRVIDVRAWRPAATTAGPRGARGGWHRIKRVERVAVLCSVAEKCLLARDLSRAHPGAAVGEATLAKRVPHDACPLRTLEMLTRLPARKDERRVLRFLLVVREPDRRGAAGEGHRVAGREDSPK